MLRFIWLSAFAWVLAAATVTAVEPKVDLSAIDRTILKEPAYETEPRYALLVVGSRAEHRAWFVVDGNEVAYLDRNANGDLTDPGERIELDREATNKINVASSGGIVGMNVFPLGDLAGSELTFQLWVRDPSYKPSQDAALRDHPELQRARQDMFDLNLLNGSLLRTAADGMQAQIPLALATRPEDAQVCHLLGPLSFALKWDDRQRLEPWPKQSVFDLHIGTRGLPPRGWKHAGFDFAPLTTSEVPDHIHPIAVMEYPTAPKGAPQIEKRPLDRRCCGDTLYATFGLPKGVPAGNVKVSVSFPLWLGHQVESAEFNVPINEKPSQHGECAYVMFHDSQIDLTHAVNVLRKANLDVTINDEILLIKGEGESMVGIRLSRAPEVQGVARGLADGTAFADDLGRCDARFEIGPHQADNEAAILQIESILQKLTHGFVYQTWDRQLSSAE